MSKWFNLDSPLMNGLNKIADIIILNLITILFFVPGMILSYFAFAGIAQTGNVNVLFLILATQFINSLQESIEKYLFEYYQLSSFYLLIMKE